MKEYLFKYEGKYYITNSDTVMDAEMKFWDEIGYDPETCEELKSEKLDSLVYSEETIIYF